MIKYKTEMSAQAKPLGLKEYGEYQIFEACKGKLVRKKWGKTWLF